VAIRISNGKVNAREHRRTLLRPRDAICYVRHAILNNKRDRLRLFRVYSRYYKTLAELAQQFEIHPNQITDWKRQLSARAADVFAKGGTAEPPVDVKAMHAKIGQLTLENDFLESALTKVGLLSAKR